ncbi:hypothetical protein [Alsobacter sp. SYSU BS001988]
MLAFHISNRHMDLSPILANAAASLGTQAWRRGDEQTEPFENIKRAPAVAVLLTRTAVAAKAAQAQGWKPLPPDPSVQPWTDDHTNLMSVLWR